MVADPLADQLSREQTYVTTLYNRLDELREQSRQRLDRVRREGPSGSPQNRSERDAFAALHADRLARLDSVEDRLCFGRLDLADGEKSRYVGRLGLTDSAQTPILIDWRAPAAVPFYQATAAHRLGVSRRRHITTRGRAVVALEDEVFDLDVMPDAAATLSGEGALLAALAAERTGRMSDIVATIQGEQDRIIRADLAGPLVVQGGPGTGKTAVALHRAAYLLYTHRDRLANSGVLMVGPSRAFLTYIDHVLPSLGETGVVCVTIGSLIPGFTATGEDKPAVAALKGRSVMARVVRRAVRNRQRLPVTDQMITLAGHPIELRRTDLAAAQAVARASHRPYNQARAIFVNDMIGRLTAQLIEALGGRELAADFGEVARDVRASRAVRIALNLCWLPMTPQGLIAELYAKPHLLVAAAPELTAAELALLARPAGSPWTVSDVPIVDEAAELLGQDDEAARRQQRSAAARERELAYARGVLASHGNVMVTAEQLADRWSASGPSLTPAERAALDRTWTYGHIVVDEAQELSAMDWRALLRRCPSRSMTVVGDVGQTHAAAGAQSWPQALDPVFGRGRWRQEQLTINYRTPASIMAPAEERARAAGVPVTATVAARDLDGAYATVTGGDAVVAAGLAEVERLVYPSRGGRTAIIAATNAVEAVRHAVENSPLAELVSGPTLLDSPLAVLTPAEAKGLEFDDVVLIDPAAVSIGGPSGPRDLYVAMTRPTRRLCLVLP